MEGKKSEKEGQPAGDRRRRRARRFLPLRSGDGIFPLEGGDCRFGAGSIVVGDDQRPPLLAGVAQLVGDALLVEDEGEIHRAPEIAHQPQQHAVSLHGAVL